MRRYLIYLGIGFAGAAAAIAGAVEAIFLAERRLVR